MASSDTPRAGDREVLSSLPNARPQRRSAKRDGAAKAKPGAGGAAKPAKSAPRAKATPKPAPVPPAGYATPNSGDDGPHGADLVTTAVQAAGELAQIGIAAGGRALKAAIRRLPRP